MKKMLLFVFLMISSAVYATEYDIIEILTYNPDQVFYAGDVISVKPVYKYTGELIDTAEIYYFLADTAGFYGWFGHQKNANDLTDSYLDSLGVAGSPYSGKIEEAITIPDMGDNCSWKVKPFAYSQTQLFFYTDDDECVSSRELSCHYDCERNTYRCAINIKNYSELLESYIFVVEGWPRVGDKIMDLNFKNGGKYLGDLSIISNLNSFKGHDETSIKIYSNRVFCSENSYYALAGDCIVGTFYEPSPYITLFNMRKEDASQYITSRNFEYLSFDMNPALIDGNLEIGSYGFEPIILSEEVPECKPGESIATTTTTESGKVMGDIKDITNPKTKIQNYVLYLIPLIAILIISIYYKYKDKIFKKI